MSSRSWGLAQVTLASLGFGFIGIFGKMAFTAGVSVGELVSIRFTLATVFLGLALAFFKPQVFNIGRNQTLLSLLLGVLGYAVFATLYLTAIQGLSVALAVLLLYTFPFWTFLLNLLLGERPSKVGITGLCGALLGLAVLLWGELRIDSMFAVFCGIGSAVTYAIYVVTSGRLQKGIPPLGSGFWIIVGAAIALCGFHQPQMSHLAQMTAAQWTPLIGLAVICTVGPLVLIQAGLQNLSSTETAILSMIEPVTASIAAAVILNEQPNLRQVFGGTLVLSSLLLVTLKGSTKAASEDHDLQFS